MDQAEVLRKQWMERHLPIIDDTTSSDADIFLICAKLERSQFLHRYIDDVIVWVLHLPASARNAITKELCDECGGPNPAYPLLARIVTEAFPMDPISARIAAEYCFTDIVDVFLTRVPPSFIRHSLWSMDACDAREFIEKHLEDYCLLPAALHHGLTDLLQGFVECSPHGVAKSLQGLNVQNTRTLLQNTTLKPEYLPVLYLENHPNYPEIVDVYVEHFCNRSASEARAVIEEGVEYWQFLRVVARHGLTDLVNGRFIKRRKKVLLFPPWTPPSPHRLAPPQHDEENAWLWLIKGDGDVDDNVWAVMKASKLVDSTGKVIYMLGGVYESGGKVTAKELLRGKGEFKRDIMKPGKSKVSISYMYAAMANHALNAVKCLVSSGVKVNARDANGWTPLHWVSDVPIAKYLVSHKADVSIRDRNGITPLGYAVDEGNEEVAEYLRSLGSEE